MKRDELESLINLINMNIENLRSVYQRTGRNSWLDKIEYWEGIKKHLYDNEEIKRSIEEEFLRDNPGYKELQ